MREAKASTKVAVNSYLASSDHGDIRAKYGAVLIDGSYFGL